MRAVFIMLAFGWIAGTATAQDFNPSSFQDSEKVAKLVKAGFGAHFDGSPLNGGTAVYDTDRDLAFWVKDGTIYAVNDRAREAAPKQPSAPPEITYAAAYDASCRSEVGREVRPGSIAMKGNDMTQAQAAKLEEVVRQHPDDIWARTVLLGYYHLRQYSSEQDRKAREGHVLWLVENVPQAPVVGSPEADLDATLNPTAYAEASKMLKAHVEKDPGNARLLSNAAHFFLISNPPYAEECLKKCIELEPANPRWHERLGFLHSLSARTTGFLGLPMAPDANAAKAALAEQERALELTGDDDKRHQLMEGLAESAFVAGDMEKARKYANEMLKGNGGVFNWDRGNNIYTGNCILGRIALKDGDIEKAKEHLIAAGKCGGSPQLNSFGPDMTLASELLGKSERDTVVQFLKLCGGFWNKAATDKWIDDIKNGRPVDLNPMAVETPFDPGKLTGFGASPPFAASETALDNPLITLPMPTDPLRRLDERYGVPLLLVLAAVLWIRLLSSWQHLWILVPLAVVCIAPLVFSLVLPGWSDMLFRVEEQRMQHLLFTYFGSLAMLWLLAGPIARAMPRFTPVAAAAVMLGAGLLGTVNYGYRHLILAEISTFVVVVTASFTLARVACPPPWSPIRFFTLLFTFNVALMLLVWPPVWIAVQLYGFGTPPIMLLGRIPMHLLISLINGLRLCAFLLPYLLLAHFVPVYREDFHKMLCLTSGTGGS